MKRPSLFVPFVGIVLVPLVLVVLVIGHMMQAERQANVSSTSTTEGTQKPIEHVPGALAAINAYRATKSLPPVSLDSQLTDSAESKASDMVSRGYWSHNTPDGQEPWAGFTRAGYDYSAAGENLARCFTSAEEMVTAWTHSPAHEAVLSGGYEDVGLGVEPRGDGCEVVVAHFGARD